VGDPLFVDPAHGDLRVKDGSPALKLGFRNFPMDQFGVRRPELKAIVKTPVIPALQLDPAAGAAPETRITWRGAILRNPAVEEYSAYDMGSDAGGVLVAEVPMGSTAAKAGFQKNDFIQSADDAPLKNVTAFLKAMRAIPSGSTARLAARLKTTSDD
jgi:hypothetical protein